MEKVRITSFLRPESGKEIAKKARREGHIPAIIYGKDFNLSIKIPLPSVKILKSIHFSESTIIEMEVENQKNKGNVLPVLIKDVQYNPLTEEVIHIDFMKVSLEEKIRVKVPIILKGEYAGAKEGGILAQMLWEVELEALPIDVPEKINLDISSLEIGDSIHVKDLQFSSKVKVLNSPQETIVTVIAKREEVEEEIPKEVEEPEVIREKEKEEPEEKEES